MDNIKKYNELKDEVSKLNAKADAINIEVQIRKKEFKQKLKQYGLPENITFEEIIELKEKQDKELNEKIKELETDKERLNSLITITKEKLSKIQ